MASAKFVWFYSKNKRYMTSMKINNTLAQYILIQEVKLKIKNHLLLINQF
mgnify:CR=1 FL=1